MISFYVKQEERESLENCMRLEGVEFKENRLIVNIAEID